MPEAARGGGAPGPAPPFTEGNDLSTGIAPHSTSSTTAAPRGLPGIGVPGVTLWWCELNAAADSRGADAATLSADEHARAARFGTEALRARWIAGRATLRRLLGAALAQPPRAVELRRGHRGRPELADAGLRLDFNVSNTRDVALVAMARDLPPGARIGVDVEHEDRAVGAQRLAAKFLTERERAALAGLDADDHRRAFLRHWTCKEAMSKATGDGLAAPFGRIDVDREQLAVVAGPPPYAPVAWTLHGLHVPTGFLATLALWRGPA